MLTDCQWLIIFKGKRIEYIGKHKRIVFYYTTLSSCSAEISFGNESLVSRLGQAAAACPRREI